MQHIDEPRLEVDMPYRFGYLSEFIGFGPAEIAAVHGAAAHLGPLVPQLVDAVYEKLFQYDATKRHFLTGQAGYDGEVPADLEALTPDHELIQFRKKHLSNYLVILVTKSYDTKMVQFVDMVGKIHTPKAGNPEIDIPLVQMNALMGFVSDALTATILSLGLERDAETATLRAFNKLLWIQNDFIVKHYQAMETSAGA